MDMSGWLHAPSALRQGKEPAVPAEDEGGWAQQPVWTLWRRQKADIRRQSNHDSWDVQPAFQALADYAVPAP